MTQEKNEEWLQLQKAHEELRSIEERYRAIFNNAAVGIDLVSDEGRFLRANSTLQDMLGYTEEELNGLSVIDITFAEDRDVSREKLDTLTKGVTSSYRLEKRYVRKDGSLLWADISVSAIRGSDGLHIATVGVISDITQRKLTELKLRDALAEAQRFREALDHVPSYVYMKDNQSRYIYANQLTLKLFGCSAEELVGCDDSRFFPPDTVKRLQEVDSRVFAGEQTFEEIDVADAGCERCVYWEVKTPIYAEPERSKIWGLLGISTDITERKKVEEALRESEQRFRRVFEQGPLGMAILGLDYRWVAVNERLCEITGYTSDELTKLSFIDITHPEDVDKDVAQAEALARGDIPYYQIEKRYIKKDRKIAWINLWKSVVRNRQGEPSYFLAMVQDISTIKKSEQEKEDLRTQLFQSQKMEALGTLVGGIAHDFNNMLQIMLGYSQLLLDDKKKGEPGYEELQTIIETVNGGADLVNKLLAFGQQSQVFPLPLDLNHQISQVSKLISRTLPHVVQIDLDLADGPTMIRSDHGQIDQLVMNLAINASDAMPSGGRLKIATTTVTLTDEYCKSYPVVKPGNYVMLSVSDTGRGMDKETVARIFDPFFSTKQRGSTRGTGLGLSVVQGIVQQQGGHTICESEPGKGTEFRIYLPAIEAPLIMSKTVAPTVQPGGAKTILVVEDNLPVAELERKGLEDAGYKVILATNGKQALDIYRSRKGEISLVILDLLMPEMSGRDCLMALLKIDPSVKALIASGYAPGNELLREISPLVMGFLHKPFAISQLINEARSVLGSDAV
jgi:two-component system cell cycle sensor histidine kinase/response regulator CckA